MLTRSACLSPSGAIPELLHPDGIGVLDELLRWVVLMAFRECQSSVIGHFTSEGDSPVNSCVQCGGHSQRSAVDDPMVFGDQDMVVIVNPFPDPHAWDVLVTQLSAVVREGFPHDQLPESTDLVLVLPFMDHFPRGPPIRSHVLAVVDP